MRFAPKFPPFIGACILYRLLRRRFADIQREKFFSFKSEKYLGNCSGIASFVSLSMKKTAESRQNDSGTEKTEQDVSLS